MRRVVEAAPGLGIGILTLFAFSSDNWQRPPGEVDTLMRLFLEYLRSHKDSCVSQGIRINVIGRRDRLSLPLRSAVEATETTTASGRTMLLRIAIDYSGREAILRAACRSNGTTTSREAFSGLLAEVTCASVTVPEVDLLIRSGGEQRLSDCLLWESAYAELFFTETMWPDFDTSDLERALEEFHSRERRFGRLPEVAAG